MAGVAEHDGGPGGKAPYMLTIGLGGGPDRQHATAAAAEPGLRTSRCSPYGSFTAD